MLSPIAVRKSLGELGVSANIAILIIAVGVGFYIYQTTKQMHLTNLQIKKLNKDLYGTEPT